MILFSLKNYLILNWLTLLVKYRSWISPSMILMHLITFISCGIYKPDVNELRIGSPAHKPHLNFHFMEVF